MDIDNTLVPYSTKIPDEKVLSWLTELDKSGIKIVILSNAKEERARKFADAITGIKGIFTIGKAGKPLKRGFLQAEKALGINRANMCMIGDQLFTDILGGNLCGVYSIWVTPIEKVEPKFVMMKRIFEKPTISRYKKKYNGGQIGFLGVLGCPVGHSVSPELHNTICEITGYNFYYDKFEVKPEELKERFDEFKQSGFNGLNITVPHKEKVMELLDEIDEDACKVGAVNTVLFKGDKACGYNTDVFGFAESLRRANFELKGKKVLIIGAGGAAKGVAHACMKNNEPARVDFCNRTASKALEISKQYQGSEVLKEENVNFSNKINEYDLIVNTTPVGMKPLEDEMPLSREFKFNKNQLFYDLIYLPEQTPLVKKAIAEGAKVINGMEMLFWQGIKAFDIWAEAAGCKALSDRQIRLIRNRLKERGSIKW